MYNLVCGPTTVGEVQLLGGGLGVVRMGVVDVKVSGDGCGGYEGEWGWVWWI